MKMTWGKLIIEELLEEARQIYYTAYPIGRQYGFSSQQYFNAMKRFYEIEEELKKIRGSKETVKDDE